MEKVKRDVYKRFIRIINRYMGLNPIKKAEKVDSTNVLIGYAIQDINAKIECGVEAKLKRILFPSPSEDVLPNQKGPVNLAYFSDKIEYLSNSEEKSIDSAIKKLNKYTYDGCKTSEICTDGEWALILLFYYINEIQSYFPINLDALDYEIYAQYCAALYHANGFGMTELESKR